MPGTQVESPGSDFANVIPESSLTSEVRTRTSLAVWAAG